MKKMKLITAILLTTNLLLGQWNNYNIIFGEYPTLIDVHFVDSMNGWMVGNNNHLIIYHSNDGGNTLEVQYESNDYGGYPSSIFFLNNTAGWVAADGIILHTDNGGQTWSQQDDGIILGGGGISIFFIDQNKGWVAGSHTILKTENGGATWETQDFPLGSFYNIHFADESYGWAVGWSDFENGILLRTTNGGNSWTQTIMEDIRLEDVFFISQDEGWMIGQKRVAYVYNPRIYHTIDGGANWEEQYSSNAGESWDMNIFFTDSLHGWASFGWLSSNSTILYTNDGGDNWIERNDIVTLEGVNSIFFSDTQHGFMVGDEGIFMRTQNSGEDWAIKGFPNKPIESVSFSDALHGIALIGRFMINGYAYYLIKTDDGGENWTIIGPPENTDPSQSMHIFMHDSLHITMVPKGQGPSIYQSVNGGYLWDTISLIGNDNDWHCGRFINPDTGWVTRTVYNQGTSVLRTYDGGNNWEEFQMSTNNYDINAVFFFPASENSGFGCAVGTHVIFITTDFGETWSQTDWDAPLNDVYFTDEFNGWIVGGDEYNSATIILHTSDGGLNWVVQESGTDKGLNSVWFTDDETGWIAGNSGTILYTSNGGNNWEVSTCPVEENLNSVCFIDDQTGWVGGVGSLLEYDGIWTEVNPGSKIESEIDFEVYPNPVESAITVSLKTNYRHDVELSIYDIAGKIIKKQTIEFQVTEEPLFPIDLSGMKPGTYFICLQSGKELITKKIIKID